MCLKLNTEAMTREQENRREFAAGIAVACASLAREHDQPGMAADIIMNTGMTKKDFAHVDSFDRKVIYKLFRTERLLIGR